MVARSQPLAPRNGKWDGPYSGDGLVGTTHRPRLRSEPSSAATKTCGGLLRSARRRGCFQAVQVSERPRSGRPGGVSFNPDDHSLMARGRLGAGRSCPVANLTVVLDRAEGGLPRGGVRAARNAQASSDTNATAEPIANSREPQAGSSCATRFARAPNPCRCSRMRKWRRDAAAPTCRSAEGSRNRLDLRNRISGLSLSSRSLTGARIETRRSPACRSATTRSLPHGSADRNVEHVPFVRFDPGRSLTGARIETRRSWFDTARRRSLPHGSADRNMLVRGRYAARRCRSLTGARHDTCACTSATCRLASLPTRARPALAAARLRGAR